MNEREECGCGNIMNDCDERDGCRVMKRLTQARASLPVKVPEGWQLVPKKPITAMVQAGELAYGAAGIVRLARAYRAMLAAAPKEGRE